jgi:thiol-disulfide isomerase/thioredoxin
LQAIKDEFSQMPETLRESSTLPNYTFLDKNDEEVNLYDFKGKILYIDLWATWCGPCLAERKYFEALIKDFESEKKEIEFIGISLDKEFEIGKWKDLINRGKFEGIQLIAKNAFESEICKDLKVRCIPRFIIVGRDGELIQS